MLFKKNIINIVMLLKLFQGLHWEAFCFKKLYEAINF